VQSAVEATAKFAMLIVSARALMCIFENQFDFFEIAWGVLAMSV